MLTSRPFSAIPIAAIILLSSGVLAAPEGWHSKLEDGLKAAKKSGKPVLVITTWTDGQ